MPPHGPAWGRVYRFDSRGWRTWSTQSPGRPRPIIFGILLVLIGIGLLVELFVPALSFFSLVILSAGIALAYAWLGRGVLGATVPALVLIGWAAARLGGELGVLPGDGWATLFVGLALLVAGIAGRVQHAPRDWALWVGAVVTIIGLADAADLMPGSFDLAVLVPLAVIGPVEPSGREVGRQDADVERGEAELGQLDGRRPEERPADAFSATRRQHVQRTDLGDRAGRVLVRRRSGHERDENPRVILRDEHDVDRTVAVGALRERPGPGSRRHLRRPLVDPLLPRRVGNLAPMSRQPGVDHHAPHGRRIVGNRRPDPHRAAHSRKAPVRSCRSRSSRSGTSGRYGR